MIPISEINRKETVLLLSLFCKHTKSSQITIESMIQKNYFNCKYLAYQLFLCHNFSRQLRPRFFDLAFKPAQI